MDYKLELVLIPVSDVDRAKEFYLEQAGFVPIVDTPIGEGHGPHPQRSNYESFADFTDPDGNVWLLQEVDRGQG